MASLPALSSLRHPATLVLLLGALIGSAQAQNRRCDLVGKDTTVTGQTFKKCLDLNSLSGKTVNVPSNVTRIDNDGLSLCKSSVSSGGDVDIVYIYDNSTSMISNYAFITANGADTLFYEGLAGCTSANNIGTVTYQVWNAAGTALQTRTVTRISSNANCTQTSGDPFNARGQAMRLGINTQAASAPQSTAGIMSFNASVANQRTPLRLNSANNVTTILGGINAVSNGGTNYRPPLDTAKRWLNTNITPNQKKAILFLSDGRHTAGTDYLAILDNAYTGAYAGPMPPIYGIFMGRPIPDTANLADLSRRTGGQFFLIPPDRPDSLESVVRRILNVILLQYNPETALVTNTTLGQSATSSPTDFIRQPDGSWLMRLSDIIGLRGSNTNNLSVTTRFREVNSNAIDSQTINFTISTTLPATPGSTVITGTQFSTECFLPSRLRIVNASNVEIPLLTEADNLWRARLRTSPVDLSSAIDTGRTQLKTDREGQTLGTKTSFTDSSVFTGSSAFQVTTNPANLNNGTLQSNQYDTVIARWVHPRDAQDFALDTVLVQAKQVGATAWFSDTDNGAVITQYRRDQTTVYIVIHDQPMDPRLTYRATITSGTPGNLLSPLDTEVVSLTQVSPGVFTASIPASYDPKSTHDNTLQVAANGDQLKVRYVDPVYGDSAVAVAGFDEGVQKNATLDFTDANGNILDSAAIWSPRSGKLYIRYTDDYAYKQVVHKEITLSLASKKYGSTIGTDNETFNIDLTPSSTEGDAVWFGSIDLADAFPATSGDGTAQTNFRGEATITAFAHDNVGKQQAIQVSDFLLIANPDSVATIQWSLADSNSVPKGAEGLVVTVKDQDFTSGVHDSVGVSVTCALSSDSVSGYQASETSGGSGTYVSGILVKDTLTPNPGDKRLSCLTADQIHIVYVDPVWGTRSELTVNEVGKPVANPPGGSFITSVQVSITAAPSDAIIYYTVDGSRPVPGQSLVYSGPIEIIGTTTVQAIAVKPGWKDSKVMVETYTKEFHASRLEILDQNGNAIPGGSITGADKAFRVKVTTTQAGLTDVTPATSTKNTKDAEAIELKSFNDLGNSFEYSDTYPLGYGIAKKAGNDSVEVSGTDTIIVTWTNPKDANDVAADTLIVKPPRVDAQVSFTAGFGDTTRVTTYPQSTDSIFIMVKTRPKDPSLPYTITVETDSRGDKETLILVETSPGVFFAKAKVGKAGQTTGDGIVDVQITGDQLTATFVDPVYKDPFTGRAGFNAAVEESPVLTFVDKNGVVLTPETIWSPTEGKVYLRFADDWNTQMPGSLKTKTAKMTLIITKGGVEIGRDIETMTLTLDEAHASATRGTWIGTMDLEDKLPPVADGKLQTSYRGQLEAVVTPHTNGGIASAPNLKDTLIIAYPNQPPEIIIRDHDDSGVVDRPTTHVDIIIKDQPVGSGNPSINATVACLNSGDQVVNVTLVWDGSQYVIQPPLDKVESGTIDPSDLKLTCKPSDVIRVTYTDPVYNVPVTKEVSWTDDKAAKLYFASESGSAITSVQEATDKNFTVVVEGQSLTREKKDTILVTLTTPGPNGDTLVVKAIETDILSGVYKATVEFGFGTAAPDPKNNTIEARIDQGNRSNRVVVTANAVVNGGPRTAELAIFAAYDLVAKAYVKDLNGDGKADHVYFVFDHTLSRLPASLDEIWWNDPSVSADKRTASGSKIGFVPGTDSTVIVVDLSDKPFGAGLTGIPDGKHPYGLFPSDNLFGGQKAALADSVGPVILAAEKHNSDQKAYDYSPTEVRFNPDTLIITLSEPIKTGTTFANMLLYSRGCKDGVTPRPVATYTEPTAIDSVTYMIIVDNSSNAEQLRIDDCVFLAVDGTITDIPGNVPPLLGVKLTGPVADQVVRIMRGYPPVAGIEGGDKVFQVVNNDIHSSTTGEIGTWTQNTGSGKFDVIWIAPAGFDPNDPHFMDKVEKAAQKGINADNILTQESAVVTHMPPQVAAVEVFSTGPYIAFISIYDHMGNFVRSSKQAFGYNGELQNPVRGVKELAQGKGLVSWLVWDMKTKDGQLAAQGVYVWKVNFVYKTKKNEIRYVRTGILRQ